MAMTTKTISQVNSQNFKQCYPSRQSSHNNQTQQNYAHFANEIGLNYYSYSGDKRKMKSNKVVDNALKKNVAFHYTVENKEYIRVQQKDVQRTNSADSNYHCHPSEKRILKLNKTDKFNESADFDGTFENNNSSNNLRHGQERNDINSRANFHSGNNSQYYVPNYENSQNFELSSQNRHNNQIQQNYAHDMPTNKIDVNYHSYPGEKRKMRSNKTVDSKCNESDEFDGSFENNNSSNYLRHGQERNYINSRANFHSGNNSFI